MQRTTISVILRTAVVVSLLAGGAALADNDGGKGKGHARGHRERPTAHWVPEFDPASAGAIAAIVAGGGVLLARRRKR